MYLCIVFVYKYAKSLFYGLHKFFVILVMLLFYLFVFFYMNFLFVLLDFGFIPFTKIQQINTTTTAATNKQKYINCSSCCCCKVNTIAVFKTSDKNENYKINDDKSKGIQMK